MDIRVDGCRYLGAAIGTPALLQSFLDAKAESWLGQVERLSDIAQSQPQAAYSAFTNGLQNKWSFLCSTMPNAATALAPVEKIIADKFIHAITGRLVNAEDRALLALLCRHGGLGVVNPTELSSQYELSCRITESLQHNIKQQVVELGDALHDVYATKKQVQTAARNTIRAHALVLHSSLTPEKRRFALSKTEFRDGLHLRYNWHLQRLPSTCTCGSQFTVSHALSCRTGGYPSIRHNEICDVTAGLLKRVSTNVSVEPHLEPLTGEQLHLRSAIRADQARLDVAANGVWGGRFERTFVDIWVFNPFAQSNQSSLPATYVRHENIKKRAYEQRLLEVEHASFVPAVFSTTGGMGKYATALYKHIASLLSEKMSEPYSTTMALIRCRLGFALVRASVMCVRGSRSMFPSRKPVSSSALVVAAEAAITSD